jgi:hypothetical protein
MEGTRKICVQHNDTRPASARSHDLRKSECDMNLYAALSSGSATGEGVALSARLSAWHDAMVAHERRRNVGRPSEACDDECPHAEALELWTEAVAMFGSRAHELTFLRSRAKGFDAGDRCSTTHEKTKS